MNMDTTTALFYFFSFVLLFAGFRVITAKSPVAAALNLVLAFFNASCIWMLLQAATRINFAEKRPMRPADHG